MPTTLLPTTSQNDRLDAQAIRQRVQRESRLIGRLMTTEPTALHDECEALHLPHEGRSVGELRAALFNHLRRVPE